jgi:hypothetical protein
VVVVVVVVVVVCVGGSTLDKKVGSYHFCLGMVKWVYHFQTRPGESDEH